jgi:hypothetical protein
MDIQTQKSYLLHDRFLSACGSELCSFVAHSLTHGQRIGAGHSIVTNGLSIFENDYLFLRLRSTVPSPAHLS